MEAIRYLAQKYGIPIQEVVNPEAQIQQQQKEGLYILLDLAVTYYTDLLHQHEAGKNIGLTYCSARGFSHAIMKVFAIGYSLDTWHAFLDFAKSKGYKVAQLEQAGLVIQKDQRTYDRFRGRIIFPIHNVSGQVIAMGARLPKTDSKQPKYINSPETSIYRKGDTLYGLFQGKKHIKRLDSCYLVEGYTDVISLHMVGISNVVASSGTSLTEQQIRLLSRFTKQVIIVFDGDEAGIKASLRGIDLMLSQGLNVSAVLLPNGEDPDSYARRVGSEALQHYLDTHTQDFITFKTNLLLKATQDDPIRKAGAIREIVQSISMVPDAIKKALMMQRCSQLLGIAEEALALEQNKIILQQARTQQRSSTRAPLWTSHAVATASKAEVSMTEKLVDSIHAYERESVRILLNYGALPMNNGIAMGVYLLQELEEINFQTLAYRKIITYIRVNMQQGHAIDTSYFIQNQDEHIRSTAIDLMATPHTVSAHWEARYQIHTAKEQDELAQTAFKHILRLKLRLVQQLIEENRTTLASGTHQPQEEDELLQVHNALKQSEVKIARQLGIVVW